MERLGSTPVGTLGVRAVVLIHADVDALVALCVTRSQFLDALIPGEADVSARLVTHLDTLLLRSCVSRTGHEQQDRQEDEEFEGHVVIRATNDYGMMSDRRNTSTISLWMTKSCNRE